MKLVIFFEQPDGRWKREVDGTFNSGVRHNETKEWFSCESTGRFMVMGMSLRDYLANRCPWPEYGR